MPPQTGPKNLKQQHLKFHGPLQIRVGAHSGVGPEFEKGDACVLASNNASPAQRGPRRDAQPPHATPLAALLFPARAATSCLLGGTATSCSGEMPMVHAATASGAGALPPTVARAFAAFFSFWQSAVSSERFAQRGRSASVDDSGAGGGGGGGGGGGNSAAAAPSDAAALAAEAARRRRTRSRRTPASQFLV